MSFHVKQADTTSSNGLDHGFTLGLRVAYLPVKRRITREIRLSDSATVWRHYSVIEPNPPAFDAGIVDPCRQGVLRSVV